MISQDLKDFPFFGSIYCFRRARIFISTIANLLAVKYLPYLVQSATISRDFQYFFLGSNYRFRRFYKSDIFGVFLAFWLMFDNFRRFLAIFKELWQIFEI